MAEKTNTKKPILSTTDKAMRVLAIAVEKAADKIATSADDAITKIAKATNIASDKLASDALKATDVVANNAAVALKVSSATTNIDHDLLTKVDLGLAMLAQTFQEVKKELKEDIKDIKNGTSAKIETNRQNIELVSKDVSGLLTDVTDLKKAVYDILENRIRKLENKVSNYLITISLAGILMLSMISLIVYHILHTS